LRQHQVAVAVVVSAFDLRVADSYVAGAGGGGARHARRRRKANKREQDATDSYITDGHRFPIKVKSRHRTDTPNVLGFYRTISAPKDEIGMALPPQKNIGNKRCCGFRALMSRLAICFTGKIQIPPGDSRHLIEDAGDGWPRGVAQSKLLPCVH
jgi:hypothetical protein